MPKRTTFRYAVTLEYHHAAPVTFHGCIDAASTCTALARALKDAKRQDDIARRPTAIHVRIERR